VVRGLLVLALPLLIGTCRLADLIVGPKGALLCITPVSPDTLRDSAPVGSAAHRASVIDISNCGGGSELNWNANTKSSSPWVVIQPDSGTAGLGPPVEVIFNPTTLDTGMHYETAVVNAPAVGTQELPLSFKVYQCKDQRITVGVSVADTLTSAECGAPHKSGSYAKIYSFTGATNELVSVEVTAAFDAFVALDSSKSASVPPLLTKDDCLGINDSLACFYYFRLPSPTTYYVEVTSADSADSGAFTMRLVHARDPNPPDSIDQRFTDSVRSVGVGATINQNSLLLRAVVSDPDLGDSLHLQAEVLPINLDFSGPNVPNGPQVANGQPAWVSTGTLSDKTSYHWRVRVQDNTGRFGPWDSLPGNTDFTVNVPHAPNPPSGLAQAKGDGTVLPPTAVSDTDIVILSATVADTDPGDQLRLIVEVRPVSDTFTTPTDSSAPVVNGGTLQVTVGPLNNLDNYHWRARAMDQTGDSSAWVSFGAPPETNTDFRISVAHTPFAPDSLAQLQSDGTTPIPVGGATPTGIAILRGKVSDPDAGQMVQLDVEVKPVGTDFVDTSNFSSSPVPNGGTASVTVGGLAPNTCYHWQARAQDATVRRGAWASFPDTAPNGENEADFCVQQPPTELFFTVQPPASDTAGVTMSPAIKVAARDINHNVVTSFTDTVTISIDPANNPGGGTLSGTLKVAAVAGVATFSDLSINKKGAGYKLRAEVDAPSLAQPSTSFTITAAATSQLVFTTNPPPSSQAGTNMNAVVTAEDQFGNQTTFGGTVLVTIANNGGSPTPGTLTGGGPFTALNGVVSFAGLQIDKTGSGYKLRATSPSQPSLKPDTSNAFSITPGPATRLVYTVQPTKAPAASPITPAVTVRALDANGNHATGFTNGVTLTITSGTGTLGATLSNGGPVTAVNGDASFLTASIDRVGANYQLDANAPGLTKATSDTFSIINSPISSTMSTVVPSPTTITASNGTSVSTITITAIDGNDQPVQGASVTLSASPAAGVTITQPSALTNASGVTTGTISSDSAGPKVITAVISSVTIAQTPTVTVNPATASALSFTIQPGNPTTAGVAINSGTGTGVVVTAVDQFGNTATSFVSTLTMGLGANPTGDTLYGTLTATPSSGVANFGNLRLKKAGSGYRLQVSGGSLPNALSNTFTIAAAPPIQLTWNRQPTTTQVFAVIDGAVGGVQVAVQDSVGNTVNATNSVTVALFDNPTGGILGGTKTRSATLGLATFNDLTVDKVGTYTMIANASGLTNEVSQAFDIVPGPVSASVSTVAAAPTTITASNGSSTSTITVTAKDAGGNPIQGATVVLSATGSGNTLTQPSGTTNASGVATGTLSSTGAGAKVVSATINTVGITQTATVTVSPTGVSAAQSTVSAAPATITASNGASASTITITARDAFGNPIQGAAVVLAASGTGNTLTQPSGTTNASGVITGTLSSTDAGAKVVSATINGVPITQTTTVTVSAAGVSPTLSTVSASPTSINASNGSSASTITVTAKDAFNNPIQGAAVVLAATGTGNTLTQPSGTTNASGVATGTLSSTDPGSKVVSATISGVAITQTATVTVNTGTVSANLSTVSAAPTSITASNGSSASTITVTAKDAVGNPIPSATVVLSATGAGNTLTQPGSTTDINGVATGTLSSTNSGAKVVSATINGVPITQTATVTVSAAGVSAAQSTVSAAPVTITASNGSSASTITVTAKDAFNNPIQGATVVLAATGTGNTLTQPSGTTNASGVATGTLSSTDAEAKIVSATISGVPITQTASVTVNPASASASHSTVSASPTTITASSGSSASTITVTALDAFDNPIQGATVVLSATGSGNTLTQPSGTTNASGVATGTLSSTGATAKVVSATIGGVTITQTATVTVTAAGVSAGQSTVSASPTSISASNGSSASTITVTARDAFTNPIQGATVVLAATGTGNTLTQPGGTTNPSGAATGTLSATKAESKTVSATINGTLVTQTATVTVTALSASKLAFTAQPTDEVAGVNIAPPVQVTVQDAFGNTVTSPRVDITVAIGNNPGGGSLGGTTTVRTGMNTGISIFSSVNIDKTGNGYTLTASAAGLSGATSSGFDITPAAPDHLTFVVQPSTTQVNQTITPAVTVEIRDAFDNLVDNATDNVTLVIGNDPSLGLATLTGGDPIAAVGGVATFSGLSIDTIGIGYTLNASSGSLTGAGSISFDITL
jgi:hypothetical protein